MFIWESQIPVSAKTMLEPPPSLMLPWRCANCGAEGARPKGPNANETMRQIEIAHARVAPECLSPRFVALAAGRAVEVRI
jgi:hypothetical protein